MRLVTHETFLTHYLENEAEMSYIELACTVEIFLLSVFRSGVKNVVRVSSCAASMIVFDYIRALDYILEKLD